MEKYNVSKKIDLGCGPKKKQGTLGVDHFPYPGVDLVFDLNRVPWPLNDNLFETVFASHVIEHINFIPQFMREIHRISKHQADIHIVTPHFSSLDSWKDPTHRWHLSMEWYAVFCNPDKYLSDQMPEFKIISSDVNFSSSLRNIYPKLISRLCGLKTWEKHYSFRYPAKNIHTTLRVVKL
jgi:hypothetical protein